MLGLELKNELLLLLDGLYEPADIYPGELAGVAVPLDAPWLYVVVVVGGDVYIWPLSWLFVISG